MNIAEIDAFNSIKGNFMQSPAWAEVKSNWVPEYVTLTDKAGNITASMLVLVKKIPFPKTALLYAPRGPVCDLHDRKTLEALLEKVKKIALKYNAYCLKIDPPTDVSDTAATENLTSLGFVWHNERVGYDNVQMRENYMLDIEGRSAEEIFSAFKPKHRYNIRLALQKGVVCDFYREEKLDDFYRMMETTGKRDGFHIRSKEYFEKILHSFGENARLCMCCCKGVPLSGALCIECAGVLSYVYGCSSGDMRSYMPNYLMQWTMIRYCADRGLKRYDFCGIPYWYDRRRRIQGVYRFKEGFGGYVMTYSGEFDYTFRKNLKALSDAFIRIRKFFGRRIHLQ